MTTTTTRTARPKPEIDFSARVTDEHGKVTNGFVYFRTDPAAWAGRVGFSATNPEVPIWEARGWRSPDKRELYGCIDAIADHHDELSAKLQDALLAIPAYRTRVDENRGY